MYQVWCEWDIGLEGKIFSENWVAERHIRRALKEHEFDESFEQLRKQGLIRIDKKEMIFE